MAQPTAKQRQTLQTLERGLRLLSCFDDRHPELGITEMAMRMNLSKTIVYRIVATLEKLGFLTQNPENRKYRLGLKVFELGVVAASQIELRQVALPIMKELAAGTNETVNLTVLDAVDRAGICIETVESSQPIKLTTRIGNVGPLHRGASRKILLAYLDSAERQLYLDPSAIGTTLSPDEMMQLEKELNAIRERGYAVSEGEVDPDAFAISAPVFDASGSIVAGLTVSGPRFRTDEQRLQQLTEWTCRSARKLSQQLGAPE
ncbi:MAG: IclR family transcriptional regulator [Novibacillus thermophilus]|jgi:IclR family KDG regulon transcriptional repressor|uniref:Glycerol operon regulatory protein n=1 Tax=Novibacillus thermophilus TaxID=1471761 RepID=A0A1U9K4I3_9BACL|nr:IclR family transcriptional regulator [Novibacillus thermophilus]AQS54934.1 hypothetical protein B0W44_03250 [Novibacillus thermophilus]